MAIPVIGLIGSVVFLAFFFALFRFENKRGARFFSNSRESFDTSVSKMDGTSDRIYGSVGSETRRQTARYIFSQILTSIISFLKRVENYLQNKLRKNRLHAKKKPDSERSRNKLDEVADHKTSVAMSEKEQKKHKEKELEG